MKILSWICRLIVAVILLQTLFFKFTGAEESKYIFSTVLSPELEAFGRIDYGQRERDPRVSTSRSYAVERFESESQRLKALSRSTMSQMVSVRSEVISSSWLPSSVVREMEFVLSHTIHHHALIAEKLAGQGMSTFHGLGVAPSTRNYWNRLAA